MKTVKSLIVKSLFIQSFFGKYSKHDKFVHCKPKECKILYIVIEPLVVDKFYCFITQKSF